MGQDFLDLLYMRIFSTFILLTLLVVMFKMHKFCIWNSGQIFSPQMNLGRVDTNPSSSSNNCLNESSPCVTPCIMHGFQRAEHLVQFLKDAAT